MPKTKALKAETNGRLRAAVRAIVQREFAGVDGKAAKAFGVTGSFLSDFLAGKRGAGPALLFGIAPWDPLEVLRAIEIDPRTILVLWKESGESEELPSLPDALARAARAAIELLHCTADEAGKASLEALTELGEGGDDRTPVWWLEQLRERLPKRKASGVRRRYSSSPAGRNEER